MQELKLIVAGGRDFNDYDRLSAVLFDFAEGVPDDVGISIVSGMAKGADALAVTFANNESVKLYEFPANWGDLTVEGAVVKTNRWGNKYNAAAGHARNRKMAEFSERLIIFWDGKSTGSKNMIKEMERLGKPVEVFMY